MTIRQAIQTATNVIRSEEFEQFRVNAQDFLSAYDSDGGTAATKMTQMVSSLADAAEVINSGQEQDQRAAPVTVVSPVVIPRDPRNYLWVLGFLGLVVIGLLGFGSAALLDSVFEFSLSWILFGPHYWLLVIGYAVFNVLKGSYMMVPDGCVGLVTKYGKVEATVPAGGHWIFHPRKRISYIVNVTKEYPYNAPIRKAPTEGRVEASVDLFLQFRIEDASAFIFSLGGVNGFSEKLYNAISEVTRALIYEQKAEDIYDLVGESTQAMLSSLNDQFLPAVRFVNANITHAEPANQEYRMDLAAPEVVRVAKEAYTYEYELKLRKEQDEGELNKELASLRRELSEIKAEVALYQAKIDTAYEKAINQANAYATRLLIEAESDARANAALLEAQALDIRALNVANFPEILEYRYKLQVLDRLGESAERLPQLINIGAADDSDIDFMAVAREMMGLSDEGLYSDGDLQVIRERTGEITARIKKRMPQIAELVAGEEAVVEEVMLEEKVG
jgi:regulator of protease activity HflC (stomatin/prohibitin superfamily)